MDNLHEEIAKVAYELFERDGRQHGLDEKHWLEAESIVSARREASRKAQGTLTVGRAGPVPAKPVKPRAAATDRKKRTPSKTTRATAAPKQKKTASKPRGK
jgi:hypothetical protein